MDNYRAKGQGIYGVHFDDPLSTESVMIAANSKRRGNRSSLDEGGARLTQDRLVQNKLYDQMVSLRQSFLREDPRITGAIPKHLIGSCLKSGGMPSSNAQIAELQLKYPTGDGRFNWILFCEHTEAARAKSWNQASRVKSAQAFKELDADGSGRLSRDELEAALKKLKIISSKADLEKLINTCDADGDGNISFQEFVDGLASNLVSSDTIFSAIKSEKGPSSPRNSPRLVKSLRQSGGMFA